VAAGRAAAAAAAAAGETAGQRAEKYRIYYALGRSPMYYISINCRSLARHRDDLLVASG